jgi:hypothetical protein
MANRIHDIGIARQIGTYSDAVEAPANARWLITAGTPGLDGGGKVPRFRRSSGAGVDSHHHHAQARRYVGP